MINFFSRYLPSIASVMILCFAAFIMYLMFFPVTTLQIYNDPFPMTKQVYEPGDIASYTVKYCRFVSGYSSIIRKLVYEDSPQTRSFPALTSVADKSQGCPKERVSLSTSIPEDSPCGKAHLEFLYIDHPNSLQEITTEAKTQSFHICTPD